MKRAMLDRTEALINGVFDIWSIMYSRDDEDAWKKKFSTLEEDFNVACQRLYEEEDRLKMRLILDMEEKLEEWSNLQKELDMEMKDDFRDDDPLTELFKELERALKGLREIKEDRLKRLAILRNEEVALCEILGENPRELSRAVPTETELRDFKSRLVHLKQLKDERVKVVSPLKKRIQTLMNELGHESDRLAMNSLFDSELNAFALTLDNIEKIKETEKELLCRKEEKIACIDSLKAKLVNLWTIVKEPQIVQDTFLQLHTGLTDSNVHAYLEEIRRVEDVVSKNIKKYITAIRNEITQLWDEMGYDSEERQKFVPFFTTTYTEDVLHIHQIERDKLRELYKDHRITAELAEKRQILLDRLKLLEEASKNKSRLYNRGGQLLKEEKERKCISSNLPKIEKQLLRSLEMYLDKHKIPFFWRGEDLLEKVQGDVENREKTAKKRNSYTPQASSMRVPFHKTPTKPGSTPSSSDARSRRALTPLQTPPFRPLTAPTSSTKRKINRLLF